MCQPTKQVLCQQTEHNSPLACGQEMGLCPSNNKPSCIEESLLTHREGEQGSTAQWLGTGTVFARASPFKGSQVVDDQKNISLGSWRTAFTQKRHRWSSWAHNGLVPEHMITLVQLQMGSAIKRKTSQGLWLWSLPVRGSNSGQREPILPVAKRQLRRFLAFHRALKCIFRTIRKA